jgi:hypothetical protein
VKDYFFMENQNKSILMLCYRFPPLIGSSFRHVNFVKKLPHFGWEPTVISVKDIYSKWNKGHELLEDLKKSIKIYRTGSLDPYRLYYLFSSTVKKLLPDQISRVKKNKNSWKLKLWEKIRPWTYIPDLCIGWIPFSIFKSLLIIKRSKVDLIFSSGLPLSSHLSGLILHKITRKPFVADFCDSWYFNPFRKPPTIFHDKLNNILEKIVITNADLVLVSYGRKQFQERYPNEPKDKFMQLFHGFNEEDFLNLKPFLSKKFTIVYTGALYGNQSAKNFISALKIFLDSSPNLREKVTVYFIGSQDVDTVSLIHSHNLNDVCKIKLPVSHKESLKYILGANLLLLLLGNFGKQDNFIIPSKIFIYIRSLKPILAIIPEGETKEILKDHSQVVFADPEDVTQISSIISKEFYKYTVQEYICPQNELQKIQKYDANNILRNFSERINHRLNI